MQDPKFLPNMRAAFDLLWIDNMPLAMPDDAFLRCLEQCSFEPGDMPKAEDALERIRFDGDDDANLWLVCAGEETEVAEFLAATLPEDDADAVQRVLNELFDSLPVVLDDCVHDWQKLTSDDEGQPIEPAADVCIKCGTIRY